MFNRKNVDFKERWGRLLGRALVVACSLTQIGFISLGIVLAFSGVLTALIALTGLIGFAPHAPWRVANRLKAQCDDAGPGAVVQRRAGGGPGGTGPGAAFAPA